MKKLLRHCRLSSLLILAVLLLCQGCSGYNHIIPSNSIPVGKNYFYFVQGRNLMFCVDQVSVDAYAFRGKIVMNKAPVYGNKVVIFPVSDKALEISGMVIIIPLHEISRVELIKESPVNKIVAILGAALVVLFVISSFSTEAGML
jgi:hypothetical protein